MQPSLEIGFKVMWEGRYVNPSASSLCDQFNQSVSAYDNSFSNAFAVDGKIDTVFDKANHNLLFAELIKCSVPMSIVWLVMSWYRTPNHASEVGR